MANLTVEQFGATIKQKHPQYANVPDYELGRATLQKYPQYQSQVEVAKDYNVPEIPGAKANRIAEENAKLATEAKQANSPLGFAANFGKALVSNLVPSEVGLGQSLQKIYGNQGATYSKQIEQLSGTQQMTAKAIREKEAKGGDATKLKQIYNDNATMLRQLQGDLKDETTLPTTGQVAGQLGGTALDLLTAGTYGKATQGMQAGKLAVQGKASLGLANKTGIPSNLVPKATSNVPTFATAAGIPELAQIARQKSAGLFTKQGLGNVAVGGGIGYGFDVTQGLQGNRGEERTGASAFIPGVGTAIGAGIPTVAGAYQSIKNARNPVLHADKLVQQRAKELAKLDSYQPLKKATEKGRARGIDVQKVLSETDVLHGSVDKTGTITTKGDGGAVEQYTKQFIDGNEKIVSEALKKEGATYPLAAVRERLLAAVDKAGLEGEALIKAKNAVEREVRGYALRADAAGNVPLSVVHDAKINKYNNINFFASGNSKTYDKTVARTLKDIVEETSTAIDVKATNAELAKHFAVIDYLNKLDNKKVDGGKLGKYFASTVGSIVGSHFGPLGAIGGAEAGGRIKGNIMARSFSGKTGRVFPQADSITQAKAFMEKPQLALPPAPEGAPRSWIGSGPTIPMAPAGTTEYVGTGKALGTYVPTQKPGTQSVLPVKTQLALPAVGESPIRLPAKNPAPVLNQAEIDAKYGQSKSNSLGSRQIAQTTTSAPTTNAIPESVPPKSGNSKPLYGLAGGIAPETDENGNVVGVTYNPLGAVVGVGAIAGAGKLKGVGKGKTAPKVFEGFADLSTKLLEKLKGRSSVSKQFISDLTNSPDLKQTEKDLVRRILDEDSGTKAYHGTNETFDNFDTSKLGTNEKNHAAKNAFFFSDSKQTAGTYGKTVKEAQLKFDNPVTIDAEGKMFGDVRDLIDETVLTAKKNGNDGVIIKNLSDEKDWGVYNPTTHYAVLDTKAIKGDQIDVPTFAEKVKAELLPLTTKKSSLNSTASGAGRYEGVNLPDELRGPVANYEERIYQSPVKTSAGDVHFGGENADNYFGHTRVEDLPDLSPEEAKLLNDAGIGMTPDMKGTTRRVIEVQSDLFQKGRLEGEGFSRADASSPALKAVATPEELKQWEAFSKKNMDNALSQTEKENWDKLSNTLFEKAGSDRAKEISKLEPYKNNAAHFRMIREEVKQAAKDGKTKLQFPTGETAMKIEGLGETPNWRRIYDIDGRRISDKLELSDLKTGETVNQAGQDWIITDVLGDGKFKAVPKDNMDFLSEELAELGVMGPDDLGPAIARGDRRVVDLLNDGQTAEQFDISGKVDTENPIYKFYEKEVGKYLKNKYGAELITDPQGVNWWQVDVKKDYAKLPVEAFVGIGAVGLGGAAVSSDEKKKTSFPKSKSQ